MAEIILAPTAQSKVIPLSIRLNDTDTSLVSQLVTNRQFSTADTDAWFSFTLEGLAATTGTFDLTLINLHDKSVFNHTDKVFDTNPFYYKLDSSTDELTNEIRHAGKWVGQLVVTLANGDSATRKFIFGIEGHILDGTVVQTILLEDYNALIATITGSKDELLQYNIDYATLIADVTTAKETMDQAEITRQATFDALVDSEMIAQNVATKLTEKETAYAPRLLSAEQQLAQIAYVVDLKRWGIDGDPINNRDGLQAAIDWAYANSYNRVVLPIDETHNNSLISQGIYLLDKAGANPNSRADNVMLNLHSDTVYDLNGCTLKINPNGYIGYNVVKMYFLKNTTLCNGTLVGDKDMHNYTIAGTHEWGYGVYLMGAFNCKVVNVKMTDFTGDGAYFGIALSDFSPSFTSAQIVTGSLNGSGQEIADAGSYRTSVYMDWDTVIGSMDEFRENRQVAAFPSNSSGYGPLNQYTVREIAFYFYRSDYSFIKSETGYLSLPVDVPNETKYFKLVLMSDEQGSFPTAQDMMIRAVKRNQLSYVERCDISNCRRQGVSISGSINSGVRDTRITNIAGTAPEGGIDIEDGSHMTEKIIVERCVIIKCKIGVIAYDGHRHSIVDNIFEKNVMNMTNTFATGVVFEKNVSIDGANFFGVSDVRNGYAPATTVVRECLFRGGTVDFRENSVAYDCTTINTRVDSRAGVTLRGFKIRSDKGYKTFRTLNLVGTKVYDTTFELNSTSGAFENMQNVELYGCVFSGKQIQGTATSRLYAKNTVFNVLGGYVLNQLYNGDTAIFEDCTLNLNERYIGQTLRDISLVRTKVNNMSITSVYGFAGFTTPSDASDVNLTIDSCEIDLKNANAFVYFSPTNASKLNLKIFNSKIVNNSSRTSGYLIPRGVAATNIRIFMLKDTELVKFSGIDSGIATLRNDTITFAVDRSYHVHTIKV